MATTPGHPIQALIARTARVPLFVFTPTDNPASRLNFTAYSHLLALRQHQYTNPTIADLYILHELHHIATMPYGPVTSFDQWNEKMTLNEKEASLFSETMIHFITDELRAPMGIPSIWADRLLNNSVQLHPDLNNRDYFVAQPENFKRDALARFRSIAHRPYTTLDATERRSWIYDRSNLIWAQNYWPQATEIEFEMASFYHLASTDPVEAARQHRLWLLDQMNDDGILFANEEAGFHAMYKRLPHGVWQVSEDEIRADQADPDACPECAAAAAELELLAASGDVERTPLLPVAQRLLNLGIAGTVYSLPYPETMAVTERLWSSINPRDMFDRAYIRRQDVAHRYFIDAFREWAAPVLDGLETYPHGYPANGSSEALKDTLGWLRGQNVGLTLHVFEGEYEGITAYADKNALNIPTVRYPRTAEGIAQLRRNAKPGDIFYLSQPSGIDGNLWEGYDDFMAQTQTMGLKMLVDLAYVGTVARPYRINVAYPHIETVFFSLSKSFGTYYQRIGGAFTRRPHPMLYGNMWFKNLLSLAVGTELLSRFDVYHLPRLYHWAQTAALQRVNAATGMEMKASDVVLLASVPASRTDAIAQGDNASVFRGGVTGVVRYCLTPLMDILVKRFGTFDPSKHMDDWRCKGMLEPKK
jgi:hypothetical protein